MTKLTKRAIDSFQYRGGWDVRWDDAIPGFGVRVYPSGRKAFVLSYRSRRRERLMVLGRYGADLTLDQARERARKERVKVGDGADPLEERHAAGRGRTLGNLIEDFMVRHVHAHNLKTESAIRRRLERNIPPAWKKRNADNIEPWEIEDLHTKIGSTRPYEANRLLEILKTMFRHAPRWKYLGPGAPNPTEGIDKFKERKRKRWVTPEEMPALARAIDAEPNVYVRAAIWLYLLTGVRKSELLASKRRDINWGRRRLRLEDTKSGEEQFVTLSAPALAIMQAIPVSEGNPYLLPGAKKKERPVNIDKAWGRIRKQATVDMWANDPESPVSGLVVKLTRDLGRTPTYDECWAAADFDLPAKLMDLRLHDLRRSFGSWLSQAGVDLNMIKEALRHASISTTLTYARLGADPAREAIEAHGQRILAAAGKREPVEVVGGTE